MARQTDIRIRRSAVSGAVPSTTILNLGELALNTYDGKLYMKKDVAGTETIVEVGATASFTPVGVSGAIQYNNNGVLSGADFILVDAASSPKQLTITGTVVADGVQSTDGDIKVTTLDSFVGFNSQRAGVPSSGGYQLGRLNFDAYSTGTTFVSGASIRSYSDGAAWTSSSTPAYLSFQTTPSGSTSLKERIKVANNGDISFYDSSGTSQNLFWDSSTSRLGLGVTNPDVKLHISGGTSGDAIMRLERNDNTITTNDVYGEIQFEGQDASAGSSAGIRGKIVGVAEDTTGAMGLSFETAGGYGSSTERLRIKGDGSSVFSGAVTSTGLTVTGTINSYRSGYTQGIQLLGDSGGNQVISTATNDKSLIIKNLAATKGIEFVTTNKALDIAKNGDISFYNDSAAQAFYWDSSTSRLSLGHTAPTQIFHIKTAVINTAHARIESTAANSYPTLSLKNDVQEYQLTTHGGLSDDFTIYDGTAGVHRLRINTSGNATFSGSVTSTSLTSSGGGSISGNLLVGTSLASAKLSVGTFGDTARAAQFHGGSILVDGGAASEIIIGDGNVAYMSIQTTDDATAMKIRNFSGNADLVTIERASGNVGIGTTSPTEKLHVAGDVSIGTGGTGGTASLKFVNDNERSRITSNYDAGGGGRLGFWTDTSGGTLLQRLTINNSGNVGIGTTTPSEKLQVNGNIALYGELKLVHAIRHANSGAQVIDNDDDTYFIINDPEGSNRIKIGDSGDASNTYRNTTHKFEPASGTEYMRINATGVGIGTTAPGTPLDVQSNSSAEGIRVRGRSSDSIGQITLTNNGGTARSQLQWNDSFFNIKALAAIPMIFYTNSTERMRIDSSGNVGIGTQVPTAKLTLADHTTAGGGIKFRTASSSVSLWSSGSGNLNTDNSFNVGSRLRLPGGNAVTDPDIGFTGASSGTGFSRATNDITFITAATERMRVNSSGILLVGKTADNNAVAGVALSGSGIVKVARTDWSLLLNRLTTDGELALFQKDGTTVGSIASDGGSNLIVKGQGNNAALLFNHTNARIEPYTNSVTDLGRSAAKFKDLYLSNLAYVGGLYNTGIYNQQSGDIQFWVTNVGEAVRIQQNTGNVGIGTSAPLAKLDVVRGGPTGLTSVNARTALLVQNNLSNGTVISINAKNTGYSGIFLGDQDAEAICQIQYDHVDDKLKFLTNGGGYNPLTLSAQNVGIGTTAPKAKLQVEEYGIDTTTTSSAATTQIAIHTFPAADFRSAKYTIQVTNTTDSTYHITEILMIHNGTTPSITEYGTIFTGTAAEATFDADILTGNVRLLATPAAVDGMQFKVVCHSITV